MSWSTIIAKDSMRVTPGSETLWSVQSGKVDCRYRFASSTRSWNVRSSSRGAGRVTSSPPLGPGRQCAGTVVAGYRAVLVLGDHVEGEHEVARVVRATQPVGDLEVEHALRGAVQVDADVVDVDPRF